MCEQFFFTFPKKISLHYQHSDLLIKEKEKPMKTKHPKVNLTLTISESEYLATAMEVASQAFLESKSYNPSMSRWSLAMAKGLRAKAEKAQTELDAQVAQEDMAE